MLNILPINLGNQSTISQHLCPDAILLLQAIENIRILANSVDAFSDLIDQDTDFYGEFWSGKVFSYSDL